MNKHTAWTILKTALLEIITLPLHYVGWLVKISHTSRAHLEESRCHESVTHETFCFYSTDSVYTTTPDTRSESCENRKVYKL